MRVGLAPLTVGRPDPLAMVAAAEAGGFPALGMTLWPPDEDCSPLCTDRRLLLRTRRRLAATGIVVTDVGVVVLSPRLDMDRLRRVLETAGALGADRVIAVNHEPDPARARATLAAVSELAASSGMLVGVEFMPYSATRTAADAGRIVSAVGGASVGVVLDVLHLFRSGGTVADLSPPVQDSLVLVQLCDARPAPPPPEGLRREALTDRRYPGHGGLPLRQVLRHVPAHVPVTLEAPTVADAGRGPSERAVRAAATLRAFMTEGAGKPATG